MDFRNPGAMLIGGPKHGINPTAVVICGLPRSGTSAFASGLQSAGIPLGKGLSNVYEDQRFRAALESNVDGDLKKYFLIRDEEDPCGVWGVKYPDAYKCISRINRVREGTLFIVTTRDPMCVALRNNISMCQGFEDFLRKSTHEYLDLCRMVMESRGSAHLLLVSYEKLLSSAEATFSQIFSNLSGDRTTIDNWSSKASTAVMVNPKGYLEESNIQPVFSIDAISSNALRGWCFFKAQPNRKAVLEVLSGASIVATLTCDQKREDLIPLHPDGLCGFSYSFNDGDSVAPGSIRLRIQGTSHILEQQ